MLVRNKNRHGFAGSLRGLPLLVCAGLCQLVLVGNVFGEYLIVEYAPGLFVHQGVHEEISAQNQGDISNSGFVVGSESVAVIDPGGSMAVALNLKHALRAETDLPVSHLILTHFHPDHVAGAAVFADVEHIVAHKNYSRAIAQRSGFYVQRFPWLLGPESESGFVQPNLTVDRQLLINLGDRQLIVNAHKTAHTDNDITVFDEAIQALWASDVVFAQRTPSLDGSLSGWMALLKNLAGKNYNLVVPGHGEPGSWDAVVNPQIRYLESLTSTVRKQLDAGVTLSELMKNASSADPGEWLLYKQQHPVNLSKAYTELEWE